MSVSIVGIAIIRGFDANIVFELAFLNLRMDACQLIPISTINAQIGHLALLLVIHAFPIRLLQTGCL